MPYEVCVYGTVCLDRIRRVKTLPPPGGYVEVLEEQVMYGGEALNTAVALAIWGVKVALVPNAIGLDESAERLLDLLKSAPPIDWQFLKQRADTQTPACDIYVTPDGNRTMFGTGFAHMSADEIPLEVLKGLKVFTADSNPGIPAVQACQQAHAAGVPVVAMDLHRSEEACRVSDIILTSTEWLTRTSEIERLSEQAKEFRNRYGCHVILTMGEQGCVLARRGSDEVEYFPAYHAPQVVDTTGSGDTFRAGLLYAHYIREKPLEWAIRFGAATAALNAGVIGACAGVKSIEEIEAFMELSTRC
jgi:sugar/nucleoside kinase (ribokinase family)